MAKEPSKYRIRNWDEFQHYKDRNPPWIKLHAETLNSADWVCNGTEARMLMVACMILASKDGGLIPNDPSYVQRRAYLDKTPDFGPLIKCGFLERSDRAPAAKPKWASRYISADLRSTVLARDLQKCRECGATERLEIDHILPISKGGAGNLNNLQVLCRPCNRRKRASLASAAQAGMVHSLVLPESYSKETEKETDKKDRAHVVRSKPRSRIGDYRPSEFEQAKATSYWRSKGRDDLTVADQVERFVSFHAGRGTPMVDWQRAWQTWYMNAIQYTKGGSNGTGNSAKRPSATDQHLAGIASLIADARAGRKA